MNTKIEYIVNNAKLSKYDEWPTHDSKPSILLYDMKNLMAVEITFNGNKPPTVHKWRCKENKDLISQIR